MAQSLRIRFGFRTHGRSQLSIAGFRGSDALLWPLWLSVHILGVDIHADRTLAHLR